MLHLTEHDRARIARWCATLPASNTTIGGRLTYEVTPNGLGVELVVRDNVSGQTLDLTDSSTW